MNELKSIVKKLITHKHEEDGLNLKKTGLSHMALGRIYFSYV